MGAWRAGTSLERPRGDRRGIGGARGWAALVLLAPLPALASPFEADATTPLEGEPTGLALADGRPVLLGAHEAKVLDPGTLETTRRIPGSFLDATALDLDGDGDGTSELLLCGAEGIFDASGEAPRVLVERPCQRVAVVEGADGPLLASAAGTVTLWRPDGGGGLEARGPWGPRLEGRPLLAAAGDLLLVGGAGEEVVSERSPAGRSLIATDGPIAGVARGPRGWAWTVPSRSTVADVTRQARPVGPGAEGLIPGRFDPDPHLDLLVLHPAARVVGLLRGAGGGEEVVADDLVVRAAVALDRDADGCDDLLLLGDAELVALRSTCAIAPPIRPVEVADARPGPSRRPAPPPPPPVEPGPGFLGQNLPTFVGPRALGREGRGAPARLLTIGTGAVLGATVGPALIQVPFFPAASVEMEWGGPTLRFFGGFDTAPLFLWIRGDEGGGVHLANASVGFSVGNDALRVGPFATAGLVNAGAGLRTVFTPWSLGEDSSHGLEARLTWFAPSTGQVMVLYALTSPSARRGERVSASGVPRGWGVCSRFGLGLGVAGGASGTEASWEYVGSARTYAWRFSPTFAGWCETGGRSGLVLGLESAPFFYYLSPAADGSSDDRLYHYGSLTVGLVIGSDAVRIGPVATAGIWTLGAGARLLLTPFRTEDDLRHGLEVRALALYPMMPAAQVQALYTMHFDPRR